jgi:hypothetical protein
MKISTLLDNIDLGAMALPEFQRGYVWNRGQVRGLMGSLYRRHPAGSLLVWMTRSEGAAARGDGQLQAGFVSLLLDGQQRITSLYGIVRGKPPLFFDGNAAAFTDLHFNVKEETFEFYAPLKMRDDPLWIGVTDVMRDGLVPIMARFSDAKLSPELAQKYLARVMQLASVPDIEFHIEEVSGENKTVDVVVEIFNRVNSGGTKLSKGDLALAKICAEWPQARDEMKERLARWSRAGFDFRLDWLLRNINAIVTRRAEFAALAEVGPQTFRGGLVASEKAINKLLNMIAGRLGLDQGSVLGGPGAFPVMATYLHDREYKIADQLEADKLLYWYVHSFLWGRYAGSTETVLNQDLSLIAESDGAVDRLINQLRSTRGDLVIRPSDFIGWSRGARFYPLLYLLTRVHQAIDWSTGLQLHKHMLGAQATLEVHHIFPKALLYKHGYTRSEVNAVANFTFLTLETNRSVSDRSPEQYIPEFESTHPGAVASHWIPMESTLWRVENYREFLAERRELLASAANEFLEGLLGGMVPVEEAPEGELPERERPMLVERDSEEASILGDCNEWMLSVGLAPGEEDWELVDPATGDQVAILDVAWPTGVQQELTGPVTLLLNETADVLEAASRFGFRYFTSLGEFQAYVLAEVLDESSEEVLSTGAG